MHQELILNEALVIEGDLPRAGRFALPDIQRLPRHDLGPTAIDCFTGRRVASVESYVGARLIDLLCACGLTTLPRSELKRSIIVAHGDDGYQAIFSWNELFNSPIGDKALVLYERNGAALGAHLGGLSLISAGDRRLGPRHLRHLHTVTVRRL